MKTFKNFYKHSSQARSLVDEIIITLTAMLSSYFTFIILANHMLTNQLESFDTTIIQFIYSFRNPLMNVIMTILTSFGSEILIIIAVILLIGLILKKHKQEAILFWFLATFGTFINQILKNIYQRTRPDNLPLMHLTSYSFPSGHSMISFIFYISLAYFIFRHLENKKIGILLTIAFALLVLLIGISRIYLGVHYPSDVLAGYTAGLTWLSLAVTIEKIHIFFLLLRNYKRGNNSRIK